MNAGPTVRIGTRGSALALAQATLVRDALAAARVPTDIQIISTEGDRRAPDTAWGEGAFVTALEDRLLTGEVEVAVHSAKDVPTDEDPRLEIAAYLPRAPQGDVIVLPTGFAAASLDDLPHRARVGTDSPRRTAFLLAARPDLRLHSLHGNVDTRLRRLDEGQSDALVLAEAGLIRIGRADRISFRLPPELVPPAPGQGAIAVQVRADDASTRAAVSRLDDAPTRAAVEFERALLAASGGGCRAPVGVAAQSRADGSLDVLSGFARPDGSLAVIRRATGRASDQAFVESVLHDLAAAGATEAVLRGWPSVLVTRAAGQAAALALALVDRGIAPLLVPAIDIEPADAGLDEALRRLDAFDWVVVTSSNAAQAIVAATARRGIALGGRGTRWAAVGSATTRALRASGIDIAFRPPRSSARDLAKTLPLAGGERVLIPRSDLADEALLLDLRERGAAVEAVVAYRTLEAPPPSEDLLRSALAARPRAALVTSGSTVRGLLALADRIGAGEPVRALPVVAIGSETASAAARHGLRVVATATSQAVAPIADATAGYLGPYEETA